MGSFFHSVTVGSIIFHCDMACEIEWWHELRHELRHELWQLAALGCGVKLQLLAHGRHELGRPTWHGWHGCCGAMWLLPLGACGPEQLCHVGCHACLSFPAGPHGHGHQAARGGTYSNFSPINQSMNVLIL